MLCLLRHALDKDEPILTEDRNRFVLFPIKDNDIWEMYKKPYCFFLDS